MYEFQLFNDEKPNKWRQNCISYKGYDAANYLGGSARAARLVSGGNRNPIGELLWEIFKNQYFHIKVQWADIAYEFEGTSSYTSSQINLARREWSLVYQCLQNKAYERDISGNLVNEQLDMKAVMKKCGWDYDLLTPLHNITQ